MKILYVLMLVATLAQAQTADPELNKRIVTFTLKQDQWNIDLTKQRQLADNQNQFANSINAEVATYNFKCDHAVPQAEYDWCLSDKARLEPILAQVNIQKDIVDKAKLDIDTRKAALDVERTQLEKELQAIKK